MSVLSEEEKQAVEALEEQIRAYRENDSFRHSPVWIWFTKFGNNESRCLLCGKICPKASYSTSNMINHIKRHHGPRQSYNAWVICEELTELKELRLMNKKTIDMRKHEEKMTAAQKVREVAAKKRRKQAVLGGGGGGGGGGGRGRGGGKGGGGDGAGGKTSKMGYVEGTMELEYEMDVELEERVLFDDDVSDEDREEKRHSSSIKMEMPDPQIDDIPADGGAEHFPSSSSSPIHINVGGKHFTSTLDTLVKFPESRIGKMFLGGTELHGRDKRFFIDRDGRLFRHVLNFCRTSRLVLPEDFNEMELLHEEAVFFDIPPLIAVTKSRMRSSGRAVATSTSSNSAPSWSDAPSTTQAADAEVRHHCVTVHVTSDSLSGERVDVSAPKKALEEVFPESTNPLRDGGIGISGGWEFDRGFVLKFPVKHCCKINSLKALQRLMDKGFAIATSSTGERDGKAFTEYLLTRKTSDTESSSTGDAEESYLKVLM